MDKERQRRAGGYRDDYCNCEGYHYTHRKGSVFCIHHPAYQFNVRVYRFKEDPVDVGIDIAWDLVPRNIPEDEPVPF